MTLELDVKDANGSLVVALSPGTELARFGYCDGRFSVDFFEVKEYRRHSRRLVFFTNEPPEAVFQGLNIGRIGQFNQSSPHSAVMFAFVGCEADIETAERRFKARLARAMKKGGISDPVVIQAAHTSCKGCAFAACHTGPRGQRVQTACSLGKLDTYAKNGAAIVEARDDTDLFFIVNGRTCMFRRNQEWAKNVPEANRAEVARKELTVRVDFLVYLDRGSRIDRLKTTLDSIAKQSPAPSSVVILNNQSEMSAASLVATMNQLAGKLPWKLVDVRERQLDGSRVPKARAVDICVPNLRGHFYCLLGCGASVPEGFCGGIDRSVVDDLKRFVAIKADCGVGPTIALGFHRAGAVNGNKAVPASSLAENGGDVLLQEAIEKAEYLAAATGSKHLVAELKEVAGE